MNWETGIGVFSAVTGGALGALAYHRSRKVDKVAEQAGTIDSTRAGTAQIITALNGLVDNLQEDNRGFRDDIKHCASRLETLTNERDELRRELARLRRKYGENGET